MTYRGIRLEALATDPGAFGSKLAREQAFTEAEWRGRLAARTAFVAFTSGEPTGLAAGIVDDDGVAQLVAMWVRPAARGAGIAGGLIGAVVSWAASTGRPRIRLWVVDGNVAAERAYLKAGFQLTGRRQPVREGEPVMEFEMARATSLPRQTA